MIEQVTWEQVEKFVDELAEIHKECHFTGVYGLPRGGLIPATMASYKLGIPLLMAPSTGCLIVDDISDTGRSLTHYRPNKTNKSKYFIATIYYHEQSLVEPDYYMKNKGQDWVVFPWEVVNDSEGDIKS